MAIVRYVLAILLLLSLSQGLGDSPGSSCLGYSHEVAYSPNFPGISPLGGSSKLVLEISRVRRAYAATHRFNGGIRHLCLLRFCRRCFPSGFGWLWLFLLCGSGCLGGLSIREDLLFDLAKLENVVNGVHSEKPFGFLAVVFQVVFGEMEH